MLEEYVHTGSNGLGSGYERWDTEILRKFSVGGGTEIESRAEKNVNWRGH